MVHTNYKVNGLSKICQKIKKMNKKIKKEKVIVIPMIEVGSKRNAVFLCNK